MNIRKLISTCFLFILLANHSSAQTLISGTLWEGSIGDSANVYPIALRRASSGNLYSLVQQQFFYPSKTYTILNVLTQAGSVLSSAGIDSSGIRISEMDLLPSSEIIFAGMKNDTLWLSKMDSLGQRSWSTGYYLGINIGASILTDSDGIVLTGSRNDSLVLTRFSRDGGLEWAKVYSTQGHDIVGGSSLARLRNGKLAVGVNVGDWMGDYVDTKSGICIIDEAGNLDSMFVYEKVGNTETTRRLQITPSGKILMLGFDLLEENAYLRSSDISGSPQWYHQYGSSNTDWGNDITIDTSGNILVCGSTRGYGIPNNPDFWIFKCDSLGSVRWNYWVSSDYVEEAMFVLTDHDNIFVSGYASNAGAPGTKAIILRIHEVPTEVRNMDDHIPRSLSLTSYPQPFNGSTTIEFTIPTSSYTKLVIYDNLGKEIGRLADGWLSAGHHKVRFNGEGLSSGPYFMRLATARGVISHKILITK